MKTTESLELSATWHLRMPGYDLLREVTFWTAYSSVVVPFTLAGTLRGASWTPVEGD